MLEIARDIIAALAYAWDEKLIHRDLKPDNIMLTNDGRTKLADLGLAGRYSSRGRRRRALRHAAIYRTRAYPGLSRRSAQRYLQHRNFPCIMPERSLSFQAKDTDSMVMSHLYTPLPPLNELIAALPA